MQYVIYAKLSLLQLKIILELLQTFIGVNQSSYCQHISILCISSNTKSANQKQPKGYSPVSSLSSDRWLARPTASVRAWRSSSLASCSPSLTPPWSLPSNLDLDLLTPWPWHFAVSLSRHLAYEEDMWHLFNSFHMQWLMCQLKFNQ